ncbi:hypothetical protein, partial [Cobetia crustatorum]|uniref:hypothetical protein n=1 Tax=Cobetia crustatorum TaxID=553385 RepID=UPI001B7FBD19
MEQRSVKDKPEKHTGVSFTSALWRMSFDLIKSLFGLMGDASKAKHRNYLHFGHASVLFGTTCPDGGIG